MYTIAHAYTHTYIYKHIRGRVKDVAHESARLLLERISNARVGIYTNTPTQSKFDRTQRFPHKLG